MQCLTSMSSATSALLLQAYLCVCACRVMRLMWGKSFLSLLGMGWCRHSAYENDVKRRLGTQGGVLNF